MKPRVLVVDDDSALAEMLGIVLRSDGFDPSFVSDGTGALAAFRDTKPDVVLLDLMLPGMSGLDVCRAIRAESGTPIIMLTAKSDTIDVVLGLESGADDYVVKPFKPKELVARMRARLRHHEDVASETLSIGPAESPVSIDVPAHQVTRDGSPINLTPLEFDLLVEDLVPHVHGVRRHDRRVEIQEDLARDRKRRRSDLGQTKLPLPRSFQVFRDFLGGDLSRHRQFVRVTSSNNLRQFFHLIIESMSRCLSSMNRASVSLSIFAAFSRSDSSSTSCGFSFVSSD